MKPLRTFTPVRAARKPSACRATPSAYATPSPRTEVRVTFGASVPLKGTHAAADSRAGFTPTSFLAATAPQLTRGGAPITERQVEIMTATLCEAIADRKFARGRADEAIPALISAMVEQIRRLNEAVAAADMEVDRRAPLTPPKLFRAFRRQAEGRGTP